jgi:benzil reductase ((S)-benzoin forming)
MRCALITGTSRGLGAALAADLVARGWRVMGCARGPAPAGLAAPGYAHLRVDLADLEAVRATFDAARPELAPLADAERAALVHNAAVMAIDPIPELGLERTLEALALNVAVPLWLTGWFLRSTSPGADVRVVEISSGAALRPYPGWPVYCASKAALRMAGQVLAEEAGAVESLRGRRIAVLSYAPHVVATGMQAEIRATAAERFPRRARFVELHETGALVAPEAPAADLAARLEADAPEGYAEARFTP